MNQVKAHHYSKGIVPFSWEKKPGVSKVINPSTNLDQEDFIMVKLPLPPCPVESPKVSSSAHDIKIPLPPCTFQPPPPPPSRTSSRKGLLRKEDDPFFAAYMECTKSTRKGKLSRNINNYVSAAGSRLKKGFLNFSCKNSCSVRDDNLVRVSQLPYEFADKERAAKLHH